MKNIQKKHYGHTPAEALFPLFESDKEYELIAKVIHERFPNTKMEIKLMYKYLASQHLPLIVLFSSLLPYGIVIKRLPPELAWNEVYCNQILTEIHPFDFDIKYHKSLGCISEKYLPGCDVVELPREILVDNNLVDLLFFWQGKCAGIAYIFGIGDRGHNERLHYNKTEVIIPILSKTNKEDPIINIDFEYFPSIRLTNPAIEASEIAISFYVIFRQLSLDLKRDYARLFTIYLNGFKERINEINELWEIIKDFVEDKLNKLFKLAPQEDYSKLISLINKRAIESPNENLFTEALSTIQKETKKLKLK